MGYEAWTEGHEKINEKYPVQVETIRNIHHINNIKLYEISHYNHLLCLF